MRRPLRVLHVLEALEGGTARHVVDVVRHVHGVDHHVALPVERTSGLTDRAAAAAVSDAGGTVHRVPMSRQPMTVVNLRAARTLHRLVRTLSPDVVHGHSSVGGALARVAGTGRRQGRPRVRRAYTPNGIVHGRAGVAVERALRPLTDVLVAVSESEAGRARELHLAPPNTVVIPNGVDLDPPPPLSPSLHERLGVSLDTPLVGTISRLVPQKAPAVFAHACRLAAPRTAAHFVLVGSGPLQDDVDRAVGPDRLGGRFHQLVDLPGAARALHELAVFVLHSAFEGGPYAPLEAMRAGVPVVLSDVVGNRDVSASPACAEVVAFGDARATADAIVRLLDEPERAETLVRAGHERLSARFDVVEMGRRTAALYVELTAGPEA